jgi:hypothetical protein
MGTSLKAVLLRATKPSSLWPVQASYGPFQSRQFTPLFGASTIWTCCLANQRGVLGSRLVYKSAVFRSQHNTDLLSSQSARRSCSGMTLFWRYSSAFLGVYTVTGGSTHMKYILVYCIWFVSYVSHLLISLSLWNYARGRGNSVALLKDHPLRTKWNVKPKKHSCKSSACSQPVSCGRLMQ